jgi:membrane protease YdiL (CAAX protease family)
MSTIPPLVPVEQGNYETPSPAPVEGEAPPRIPHMGHVMVFLAILAGAFFLAWQALLLVTGAYRSAHLFETVVHDPTYLLVTQAGVYIGTLLAAWLIFPHLWERGFTDGMQWNAPKARKLALKLIPAGIAVSYLAQGISAFVPTPKTMPMDEFFKTRTDVWITCALGTLLAPLIEEIFFRGFLFPAMAIAYDWLSLSRSPEAVLLWRSTTTLTTASYVFSGLLTSIFFALLHGAQLAYTWPLVVMLLCVSGFFTWVRLETQSVACSTLLHASYNFAVFLTAFIGSKGFTHLENLTR